MKVWQLFKRLVSRGDRERTARLEYVADAYSSAYERVFKGNAEAFARFLKFRAEGLPANWRELAARQDEQDRALAALISSGVVRTNTDDEGPSRLLPYTTTGLYAGVTPESVRFGAFLGWKFCPNSVLWCLRGLDSIIDEDREPESLVIVEHQSGGHACDRDAFLARPLVLSDSGVTLLAELTAPYYHKGSGHFHSCTARDIEEYRQSLRAAQLTADKVFAADYRLIEGVYPLDPTPENLAILTGDHSIPLEVIKRIMSADDARKHLAIIVLADNSD